ncbi:MAG: hypothetical protein L0Z63_10460 [Actinobacteria bacterium]|nr:hypothetical protein [Actinomycetota bacterium]
MPTTIVPTTSAKAGFVATEVTPIDPGPHQAFGHSVVWTGSEVIVWGGHTTDLSRPINDGAAFNPGTGQWRTIAAPPIGGMTWHFAAWSGTEMLVVGASGAAAYNPRDDSWRMLTDPPLEIPRPDDRFASRSEYAWSGSHIYVWSPISDELTRFDLAGDEWEVMEGPGLDVDQAKILADGKRLLVFGTRWPGSSVGPATTELLSAEYIADAWHRLPLIDFATNQAGNIADPGTAIFVRDSILVWGDPSSSPGAARLLRTDGTWDTAPPPPIDENLLHPRPIPLDDGRVLALSEGGQAAIWEPDLNAWTPVGILPGILGAREAVWTGHEVIAPGGPEPWRWTPPATP